MVQLIRHVRRPEASEMAVEDVALDRLTEAGRPAGRIGFPAWRKRQRTSQRKVWWCRKLLERDDILTVTLICEIGDPMGLAIDWLQMCHSTASAFASSRSNRAM
jgi:hypothetical protein